MAEYIDRTALAEKLLGLAVHYTEQGRIEAAKDYNWAITLLMAAPTADVAPVKYGRWEFLGPNMLNRGCMCGTCSACKVRSEYIVNTGLCPNCGAKMDGGEDREDD